MTTYRAQVEVSGDGGRIWQAVDASELVNIGDSQPAEWFDASECAREIEALPGGLVRVLVWPAEYEGYGTEYGTVYIDEFEVPQPIQAYELVYVNDDNAAQYGYPVFDQPEDERPLGSNWWLTRGWMLRGDGRHIGKVGESYEAIVEIQGKATSRTPWILDWQPAGERRFTAVSGEGDQP